MSEKSTVRGYIESHTEANHPEHGTLRGFICNGVRYGTWTKACEAKEGTYVSFEATQNGKFWNADLDTLKVEEAPKDTPAATKAYVPTNRGGPGTQRKIEIQSARRDAIAMAKAALELEVVELPKTKANRLDVFNEMVMEFTRYLLDVVERADDAEDTPEQVEDVPL